MEGAGVIPRPPLSSNSWICDYSDSHKNKKVATLRCGDGSCIYEGLLQTMPVSKFSDKNLVNAIIIVHANVQPNPGHPEEGGIL